MQQWHDAGITRAIVSLESGPALLPANPAQAERLAERFAIARAAGVQIEGLILQDASWTSRLAEARGRARVVGEFLRAHPGLLDRIQIDVEPYAAREAVNPRQAWSNLAALLRDTREEFERAQPGTRLSAALPWWAAYAMTPAKFSRLAEALDDIVVMAYGDPGGAPVAAEAHAFRQKVLPALRLFGSIRATLRIGVARYEHASATAIARHVARLEKLLKPFSTYAGTACFHEAASYLSPAASGEL